MVGAAPTQKMLRFPVLPESERRRLLDRTNKDCVFCDVVGQEGAIDALADFIFEAYGNEYRLTEKGAILLHGGRSNGKTMLAKKIGAALQLPFVKTSANAIRSIEDIFALIIGVANEMRCPMVQLSEKNGKPCYKAPNIVLFIDEIHALPGKAVMGLLTALEAKDGMMILDEAYVDVSNILWIGATTERGDLFVPFESRFYKIAMLDYTRNQIAKIIKLNYAKFSNVACEAIATRSGCIAREALDLAEAVRMNMSRLGCTVEEAIANVCVQKGIDEFGMTKQQIWVLSALAQKPKGLNYEQLCRAAQCNVEELKRYVLPPLLTHTEESAAKVVWTGQRSCLTPAGVNEVKRRGLPIDETAFSSDKASGVSNGI